MSTYASIVILVCLVLLFVALFVHLKRPHEDRMPEAWLMQFRRGYRDAERWRDER